MSKNAQQKVPRILLALARLLGTEVRNGRLEIPERFGSGYCAGFIFNDHIRMMILHYELKEDIIIEDPRNDSFERTILFKFQHVFGQSRTVSPESSLKASPSVLIATRGVNADAVTVHTHTAVINIEVDANYVNGLFDSSAKSVVLQSLLQNTQPLLFEQLIYSSLQKIVDEIVSDAVDETFKLFFLRVKAEELICKLLMELEKRDEKQLYALNNVDVQTLYKVRDQILEHLDVPPVIDELALVAMMSPTKLKRLFKQIFGNSIFSYYQEFRMKEGARLLKEENLSVADVAYKLGFTNLSHFAKAFKEHMGMNPKRYSRS